MSTQQQCICKAGSSPHLLPRCAHITILSIYLYTAASMGKFRVRVGNTKPPPSGYWNGFESGNVACSSDAVNVPIDGLQYPTVTIPCNLSPSGRYLTVQLLGNPSNQTLTMCDIQVQGCSVVPRKCHWRVLVGDWIELRHCTMAWDMGKTVA